MPLVPFQTIMVGIDTTEVSETAFDKALVLAKGLNAKLLVAHVLSKTDCDKPQLACSYSETGQVTAIGEADSAKRDQREWNTYLEGYKELLAQKVQAAEDVGVTAEPIETHGVSGAALCYMTRRREVDLLVVGSHRREGLSALSTGSTSNYIIKHAPCPVLVVHLDAEAR